MFTKQEHCFLWTAIDLMSQTEEFMNYLESCGFNLSKESQEILCNIADCVNNYPYAQPMKISDDNFAQEMIDIAMQLGKLKQEIMEGH